MKGNNLIEELEADIKVYNRTLARRPNDDNSHHVKGCTLVKIGKQTGDSSYFEQALECYNKAIELTKAENAIYLIDRSKLYVDMGKTDLAVQDVKRVGELPKSSGIAGLYVGNTIRDIAKLDAVQTTITQLAASGKINKELANALQEHAKVTAGLVVQVGSHSEKLDNHDDRIEKLEALVHQLQEGKKLSDQQIDSVKQETAALKSKVGENTAKIESHEIILQDSGTTDKAAIKQGFEVLEKQSPELYAYCKTFYWTTLNLFCAYRSLSTGLILGKITTTKDEMFIDGVNKVASYGADLAKGIPFVGSIIGILDSAIDGIYSTIKTTRFENKVNSINKIIQSKLGLEEDISLNIAKVALAITEAKKDAILHPATVKINKLEASIQWLQSKLEAIKDKVLPSVELNEKSDIAVQLALQDVTLVMAYLCKNYEAIINEKEPLDKQIVLIVQHGSLDQLLIDAANITATDLPKALIQKDLIKIDEQLVVHFSKIEKAIGKDDLDIIHQKAAEGKWSHTSYNILRPLKAKGLEDFLQDSYIQGLFGKAIVPDDIEATKMFIFKHICIGITNNKGKQNLECAKKFSETHKELVKKMASIHPEFFINSSIAQICISDQTLKKQVIEVLTISTNAASSTSHDTIVNKVDEIIYDNPLLKHDELLQKFHTQYGSKKTQDLIELTSKLSNESYEMVEDICQNPNAFHNLELLIGVGIFEDNFV